MLIRLAALILSALAAAISVQHQTPVDAALPLIVSVVVIVAWASQLDSMFVAVPLLIASELFVPDDKLRLLSFGIIVAIAFGFGVRRLAAAFDPVEGAILTAGAVILLRWIPLSDVRPGREIFLIACAIVIAGLMRFTPAGIASAVIVALITPAVPLRTLILPIMAVIVFAGLALVRLTPRLPVIGTATLAVLLMFFAWSGVVARSFPFVLRPDNTAERRPGAPALAAGRSLTLDLPDGARYLILSGANVARLPKGTPVGRIEPGGRVVRIGDVGDWGFMRRNEFAMSKNSFPRDPAGIVRGYGYSAWLHGSGRIALPPVRRVTVIADSRLPEGASLQIDAVELGQ